MRTYPMSHSGGCCGINQMGGICRPADLKRKLRWEDPEGFRYHPKIQYHYYCSDNKRPEMEPTLLEEGFKLLATNSNGTIWGIVG